MLLIVIALLWVALLTPMALRKLRDRGTERSIESFHTEHEVLSRQPYAVAPAHRLSEPDPVGARDSRLTVVHADDTYRSLESRRSWEEWSEDYDYDRYEPAVAPANRYAHAYSSVPREEAYARATAPRLARRSARAQRRLIFSSLAAAVVVTTGGAFLVSSSMVVDLAIVAWVALAGYVSLALYAVSAGYLDESSLGMRRRAQPMASVAPLRREPMTALNEEDEFGYDDSPDAGWRRSSSRYALG